MREHLFRAKRLNDGEWVDGSLFVDDKKDKHEILVGYVNYRIIWEVDPNTVGQYTGLTDRNGVMIFEDDILRFMVYGTVYTGKVQFLNGAFWVKCRFNDRIGAIVHEYKPEIIGNIHDNPELLEVK